MTVLAKLKQSSTEKVLMIPHTLIGDSSKSYGAKIGTKMFEFNHLDFFLITRLTDNKFLENHMIIEIEVGIPFLKTISEHLALIFKEVFHEMVTYWYEYAKMKGYQGVMVGSRMEHVSFNMIKGVLSSEAKEKLSTEEMTYLQQVFKNVGLQFIGGIPSSDIQSRASNYVKAKQIFDEILEENPLIINRQNGRTEQLVRGAIFLSYGGRRFEVMLDTKTSQVNFSFLEAEDIPDLTVDIDKDSILTALESIKEDNKLAALLNQPVHHFKLFLNKALGFYDESRIEEAFHSFVGKLGNWEEVERTSALLMRLFMEDEYKTVINAKDKDARQNVNNIKNITILRFELNDVFYFFVHKMTGTGSVTNDIAIIVSKTPKNQEVRQLVIDYLLVEI